MSDNNNLDSNMNLGTEPQPQVSQEPVQMMPQQPVESVPVVNTPSAEPVNEVPVAPLSRKAQKAADKQAAKDKKAADKQAAKDKKAADKQAAKDKKLADKKARKAKKKADKKERKKQKKIAKMKARKAKRKNKTTGQKIRGFVIKLVLLGLLAVVLTVGALFTLTFFNLVEFPFMENLFIKYDIPKFKTISGTSFTTETVDKPEGDEVTESTQYTVETINASEYFEDKSQSCVIISAADSPDVETEEEAIYELNSREIFQYEVVACYSMDGEYGEDIAESYSDEMHPTYETYYVSEAGELWTIYSVNGFIMAEATSYEYDTGYAVGVIVSESNYLMSYDSNSNSFYQTVPNPDQVVVIQVDEINAETLDSLTISDIAALVG